MADTSKMLVANNAILIVIAVFAAICIIISLIYISHRVHIAQKALDAARASRV